MTPEEFRKYGHAVVDWIADYRARVARAAGDGADRARARSRRACRRRRRDEPEPFDAILARPRRASSCPGLTHWQHPQFFGYFPCNGTLASVLGDYVSTGLGVLGLAWQSSPALTELEEVVTDWLRQMVGLSDGWSGVIQDTASTSTLVALLCARERTHRLRRWRAAGCRPSRSRWSSTPRRTATARSRRRRCWPASAATTCATSPATTRYAHARRRAGRGDRRRRRAAGRVPCAVVATTGTTTTTALDPVAAIARGRRRGTGSGCTSTRRWPARRWSCPSAAGCGRASRPPTRWCSTRTSGSARPSTARSTTCATPQHLVRVMSTNPSYLQTAADGRVKNYRDWGIPLGRRFRALKLWFLIREQGVARPAGAAAARPRRTPAGSTAQVAATPRLAGAGAGAAADACACATSRRADRRGARPAHARRGVDRLNRSGRRLPHAGACSTAAGWCASRSAPSRPSAPTSNSSGPPCSARHADDPDHRTPSSLRHRRRPRRARGPRRGRDASDLRRPRRGHPGVGHRGHASTSTSSAASAC